jgi:hypothetical protein
MNVVVADNLHMISTSLDKLTQLQVITQDSDTSFQSTRKEIAQYSNQPDALWSYTCGKLTIFDV